MGLLPGTSFYLSDVKVTKQKGFRTFDIAGYWRRKYRGKEEYVVIVVFELDYMVNLGRSEAEGVDMEFCQDIITELMRIRRNKLPFFQRGMRAMSFILSTF